MHFSAGILVKNIELSGLYERLLVTKKALNQSKHIILKHLSNQLFLHL
jgi:hypothetical protein